MAADRPTPIATYKPIIRTPHTGGKRHVSVLVQGPPGEGKTHFMASWPQPFFLVFDHNTATHDRLGVPYVPVTWSDVDRYWLRALEDRRLSELVRSIETESGEHPYADYKVETLCIDSLTFMLTRTKLELSGGAAKDMGYAGWDKYYARAARLLTKTLEATKPDGRGGEEYHCVVSVHESNQTNDEGKVTGTVPAVQGQLASHFTAFFDAQFLTKVRTEGGRKTYQVTAVGDNVRRSKGDTIGGLLGTYPNSYEALAKEWGWT